MNFFNFINKLNIFKKLILILIVFYIVLAIHKYFKNMYLKENFDSDSKFTEKYVLYHNDKIYDDFYSKIYDKLVYDDNKNIFEVKEIVKNTKPSKNTYILDVGSGTGHHVNLFNKMGYKTLGVDKSNAMIKQALINYPNLNFKHDDINKSIIFSPNTFTHITCFYFTIYYIKNKEEFFQNCFTWLLPGGFLVIHLANKTLFDPILPAGNPFLIVSPQTYSTERITDTVVKFNNFNYKSNFELHKNSDKCIMHETFKNNNGNVRKHEHELHMPSQKKILTMAKNAGFTLNTTIDMIKCNHDNQFLYILQKPY